MKKIILLSVFMLFSTTLFSQEILNSKKDKIEKLLKMTGSVDVGVQIVNTMIDMYKKNYTSVEQKFWDDFSKEVKTTNMLEIILPIYDKYFTEEDIDVLIAFYSTPSGKKMITNLPNITQDSMLAGQKLGRDISDKIINKLKNEGYITE
ncbi:DUF2059 domain-containing protein [Chishuiella sp.]|uniref:DUF2059 domain-containing protein n=1 Tax=Chishuiella sp. TaxID=1969467 RepID=UPI0028ADECDA|nr:DUF2059 domain-containing protein [Chishuiella sp.]